MTVDEFLAWAEDQPRRYELYDGVVYAMTPERAVHAKIKFAVQVALANAVRTRGLPCHMLPDGMTVRVAEDAAHEPDALVYCGAELPSSALEVPNPVIIVEVLSPSTKHIDGQIKLTGYFGLPSVRHYLVVDPDKALIVHHARMTDDTILTRIVTAGTITLDPPGIDLSFADIYGS
ncbi:MAG: Uma2 family endonuclease [Rhizobiales bacterium]|nr:Uma2 family endonuclease [Hyphomicrobiales bacterium]